MDTALEMTSHHISHADWLYFQKLKESEEKRKKKKRLGARDYYKRNRDTVLRKAKIRYEQQKSKKIKTLLNQHEQQQSQINPASIPTSSV